MVRNFLLDTNCLISVKNANGLSVFFGGIKDQAEELRLWITSRIFDELKGFSKSELSQIRKNVEIAYVDDKKILLTRKNLRLKHPPQTADLSLLTLAQNKSDIDWTMVTDDFKLAKAAQKSSFNVDVWTPSVFILYLKKNVNDSRLRDRLNDVWHDVMSHELEYALSRKDVYPPRSKLAWLIERSTRIVGRNFAKRIQKRTQTPKDVRNAIMRYLMGEQLRSDQKKIIAPLIPYISELQCYHKLTSEIQQSMNTGDLKGAAGKLQQAILKLRNDLQIGLIALDPVRSFQLLETYTAVMAQYAFLAGICQINTGNIESAISYFSSASFDSLIAGYDENAIRFNYLTAVLLMADKQYAPAVKQYAHTQRLAKTIGDEIIRLKSRVGEAVALFFAGSKQQANLSLKSAMAEMEQDPILASTIFNEFGDQLYSLGLIEVAFYIYQEGYNNALKAHKLSETYDALADLVRCYFNLGKPLGPLVKQIKDAISLAKREKNKARHRQFQALYDKVYRMLKPTKAVIPKTNQRIHVQDINPVFSDWLSVIHVVDQEYEDLVIVYIDGIGNIGIIIPNLPMRIPIPESVQVRIKPKTLVEIRSPRHPESKKYFVHAEIVCPDNKCIEIRSTLFESVAL
ncbi:MAG: hypothetical protein ACTSW4_07690 [Candidatus Ranarchaeia archaeon]